MRGGLHCLRGAVWVLCNDEHRQHESSAMEDNSKQERIADVLVVTPLKRSALLHVPSRLLEDTSETNALLSAALRHAGIDPAATPGCKWGLVRCKESRAKHAAVLRLVCTQSGPEATEAQATLDVSCFVEAYSVATNWVGLSKLTGNEGWVALDWAGIAAIAKHLTQHSSSEAQSMRLVDLGSGTGSTMIGFGAHGIGNVVGIELDPALAQCSREVLSLLQQRVEATSQHQQQQFRVIQASYYTRDLALDLLAGRCWAAQQQQSACGGRSCEERMLHVALNTQDVDAAVRSAINSADVVCAFLWSVQVPSVMELFVRHGRANATLVVANSNKHVVHPLLQPGATLGPTRNTQDGSRAKERGWVLATEGFPVTVYRKRRAAKL